MASIYFLHRTLIVYRMASNWWVEEWDFTFVLIIAAIFFTLAFGMFYCDREYRHNFYFGGEMAADTKMTYNFRSKLNQDIIRLSEVGNENTNYYLFVIYIKNVFSIFYLFLFI